MERKYTEQHLDKFFEGFKSLSNPYTIEKVHQLIHNPDAKATHRVNQSFIHLKFIIMTSAFIVLISAFLFWLNPMQTEDPLTSSTINTVPGAGQRFDNTPLQKDGSEGLGKSYMSEKSLSKGGNEAKN